MDPYVEDPRATHNAARQPPTIAQQAGCENCGLARLFERGLLLLGKNGQIAIFEVRLPLARTEIRLILRGYPGRCVPGVLFS
jgi:hypothetical protein